VRQRLRFKVLLMFVMLLSVSMTTGCSQLSQVLGSIGISMGSGPRPGYPPPVNPGYPPAVNPGYPPPVNPGYPPPVNPGYPPVANNGFPPAPNTGFPPAPRPGQIFQPPPGSSANQWVLNRGTSQMVPTPANPPPGWVRDPRDPNRVVRDRGGTGLVTQNSPVSQAWSPYPGTSFPPRPGQPGSPYGAGFSYRNTGGGLPVGV
jgi:hypothetical protein